MSDDTLEGLEPTDEELAAIEQGAEGCPDDYACEDGEQ